MSNQITLLLVFVIGINISSAQTDPSNIACAALNSTTLSLSWTQATDVSVQGYFLYIERVDGLRIEPDIPSVNLNLKTYDNYQFYGLGKYGTYNITIHSYTSVANLTSYVTTCTTAEDVPNSAPLTFYCTGISTSSVRCTWSSLDQVYWNGVPVGFRLQWLSSNLSSLFETTVSSNLTTTLVTGLNFGTLYYLMLNPYTSIGQGTLYSTTSAYTLGFSEPVVENVTRYYCNEAVPGFLVFGWEEMPCTIYTGTISALFVVCGLFIGVIACMSCCSKTASNDISLNFLQSSGGKRRRRRDDDDDDSEGGDTDNDADKDEDMTDDEEHGEYDDDDGYENKGYRSDEDPKSPESRKTYSPDDETHSQGGTPDLAPSRQSGMMGGAESKKMELERQLTARDVELEAISEDEDAVPDSDYDTQSEYDDTDEAEQENNGNGASAAGVAVFASKDVKAKGKKNVKEIKAIGKAKSTTLLNKDTNKNINATVALIHTEDPCNDKIANNNENYDRIDSPDSFPLELRNKPDYNKSASGDIAPDDDWGEDNKTVHFGIKNGKFIKGAQPNMKSKQQPLQSTSDTRKSMVKIDNDWDDDLSSSINDSTSNTDAMARLEADDWGSPIDDKTKNTNMHAVSKGKSNMYTKTNVPITDENNWDNVVTEELFTLTGSKTILSTMSKQNSTRTNEYELKSLNLNASQSSNYNDKALNKEFYNGNPLKRMKGIKTPINELEDDDDWGTDVTTENIKGPISVYEKATYPGKMPSKSKTTVLQTQNKNESHEILKHNYNSRAEAFNGTENKTGHGGKETRFINNASNIGQHTKATSRKVQIAHNSQITENQSKSNKAKTQEKEKGITNTKGQSANQLSKVNRDTNQSLVVPKKEIGRNQQTLQDQHIVGSQQNTLNSKAGNTEQKTRFFIEDEIDDVNLPNDNIQRPDSAPTGKKISTKAWLPQPNNDGIKSGRKTPVKAFPKLDSYRN